MNKYIIFSPTHGRAQYRLFPGELNNDYRKCKDLSRVKTSWNHFYSTTHFHYQNILCGYILTVFLRAKHLFEGSNNKFQMVRVNTGNNKRIIGFLVPTFFISRLKAEISQLL